MENSIRKVALGLVLTVTLAGSQSALADQTLVFVRHGEKPDNDSGQLTCKGLNRALALPDVLMERYGKPEAIFAAGPKEKKSGSSLRSLTTMTPTAIRLSLPINIQYHADDIQGLQTALLSDSYQNSVVFVAWEHKNLVKVVKNIVKTEGGNLDEIPPWPGNDFDSVFVLTLNRRATSNKVIFTHQQEHLNDVSAVCNK
ncbi:histidine phosphatase family protein [Acerihabitans sp. TG2]|uniref:histidine phosphatase family protein n=1 Tax=Acerihabitans sp. TG2 TaxID=3096008 RepID=UPI002B22272F|nr:histidine phosphatase family protein [Acerihabitans sp. TG2]MEA9391252.1 histidine phosphatase family protein [Acerihabitans sp. TG2]